MAHIGTLWTSLDRVAYVIDGAWATVIGLVDAVTPMHLRAFSTDEDAEARAWILDKT